MKAHYMNMNFPRTFRSGSRTIFLYLLSFVCFFSACKSNGNNTGTADADENTDPRVAKLKLQNGFRAQHLYSPGENDQGSWVAMAFDDKGRMIACDQYGHLYRLTIPAIDADTTKEKVKVEKIDVQLPGDTSKLKIGYAHGLLYALNSLYIMVNDEGDTSLTRRSGLYRLQDTNGDDQFDKISMIKRLEGDGEHGPHTAVLAPDGKSIYVIAGNFTKIPEMNVYHRPKDWEIDNLLPLIRDPNGHDNTVANHGGWIAKMDTAGNNWELVASGFRNPFDMAFNNEGELFTYDSDMEWDFGTPWYRPTRILHVTSGAEYGWRPGTDKWPASFADNLPAAVNVGQGSPTSFFSAHTANFPDRYKKALFAFDWSFGIIYSIFLEPQGATYKARGEEFVSGSPLPLTDGIIGPDGALYFLTGGRRLESNLYRVYYDGKDKVTQQTATVQPNEQVLTRRKIEAYHGAPRAGAIDFVWPYLSNEDRFIRYAARIAVEHQPVAEWQQKALSETDPVKKTQAAIALAHKGDPGIKNELIQALTQINFSQLSEPQQLDLVRAFELILLRMEKNGASDNAAIASYLSPHYPAKTNELNRYLSKVLVYIDAPDAVQKTMALLKDAKDDPADSSLSNSSDLIMRNPQYGLDIARMLSNVPPGQQTFYATVLSQAKNGWTPETREAYFKWFYDAFQYKGGHSFIGFINNARKQALENAPKADFARFNVMSGDSLIGGRSGPFLSVDNVQPKGPGRRWKLEEAVAVADSGIANRNFETGRAMFSAGLCQSCHTMQGEGGVSGPDLTNLGTRFSYADMLDAIINPNKTISDQYGSTVFYLKQGGSIIGRMISQDNEKYVISQNPFAPDQTREVLKSNVQRTAKSDVSPMLPGLINRMNPEELKDLLAYLKAGGKQDDTLFTKGNQITRK